MDNILGLKDQPALVVGGGYGIGKETALLLARAGARVAVADIDPARARKVAEEIGGHPVAGDVTTQAGAASGVVNSVHQLGGALGMSLVLAVSTSYAEAMRDGAFLLGLAVLVASALVVPATVRRRTT